jgi:hypothetical protein
VIAECSVVIAAGVVGFTQNRGTPELAPMHVELGMPAVLSTHPTDTHVFVVRSHTSPVNGPSSSLMRVLAPDDTLQS